MNAYSFITKIIFGSLILVMGVLFFSHIPLSFAQTNNQGTTAGDAGGFVICGNTAGDPCKIDDLFSVFIIIINYLITMAGFISVLAIVYAGFLMAASQGQSSLAAAKGRLTGAIIGMVLVAAAYVLINSLFAGTFSIGVCDGTSILTSPLKYIQSVDSCKPKK